MVSLSFNATNSTVTTLQGQGCSNLCILSECAYFWAED